MPRRSSLITSATRRMAPRRGVRLVYKSEPTPGRAKALSEKDKQIDNLLRGVLLDFDFTPIFSGDALLARLVASDIYMEVRSRADVESSLTGSLFTTEEAMVRWEQHISQQVESIAAFKRAFSSLLKKRQT